MGKAKQAPTKQQKTDSKTIGKPASGVTTKDAKAGRPRGKAKKEPLPGDGGMLLRSAVDELVIKEGKLIARALVNTTCKGSVPGARLVVELTDAKKPQEKPTKKRRGPTLAQCLERDKPWRGPSSADEEFNPELREPVAS
jgi:hypothetical protein